MFMSFTEHLRSTVALDINTALIIRKLISAEIIRSVRCVKAYYDPIWRCIMSF